MSQGIKKKKKEKKIQYGCLEMSKCSQAHSNSISIKQPSHKLFIRPHGLEEINLHVKVSQA